MKVALTGGGTGGHAYPAIAVAGALKAEYPDCELLYIGGKNSLEERLAAEAGLKFFGIKSRKLQKLVSPDSILTAAALARGFAEAYGMLAHFRPDVVIGTGGYASAAVVMAQSLRRGKTIILEQDVIPGRTSRWLSRYVTKICLAFEDAAPRFPSSKTVVTGAPIRSELLELPSREDARKSYGLKPNVFTLLVLGGSQGARRLNEVVADAMPALARIPVQVLHQAGPKNIEEAQRRADELAIEGYSVRAYLDDMRSAYAAADFAMCRSGSSTIAETTAVGLPALLVPYPFAHADHQRFNAESVARGGGALAVVESGLNAEILVEIVQSMVSSPARLKEMSAASKKMGKPRAAFEIARLAVDLAGS